METTHTPTACDAMTDLEQWLLEAGLDFETVDECPEPVCAVCSTSEPVPLAA